MAKEKKEKPKFPARVRFNWGYHDGADDAQRGRPYRYTHFDKVYIEGWKLGHRDAKEGNYHQDSTAAWNEYKGNE